jgi:CRP-like cAMP-binding protein
VAASTGGVTVGRLVLSAVRCRDRSAKLPGGITHRRGAQRMEEVLANAGIFQGIATDAVEAVAASLVVGEYVRGATVFAQDEPGDTLYIVMAGKIKIGRRAPHGRENMLSVMGPSDMFGEMAWFDPGPRTATASVVTGARLACLAHSALRPWLTDRPEIGEQLLRVLARRLRRTNDAVADLIFTDVAAREPSCCWPCRSASARKSRTVCEWTMTSPRKNSPS